MDLAGHGVDMVDCRRLAAAIERHGERFLRRVFTEAELDYCRGKKRRLEHLAGRFAAKEAVLKVLGTGWQGGINWTDIEVTNEPSGQPRVRLSGRCRDISVPSLVMLNASIPKVMLTGPVRLNSFSSRRSSVIRLSNR